MSVESEEELESKLEEELKKKETFINEQIVEIVYSKTLISDELKNKYISDITSSIGSLIYAKNNVLNEKIKKKYNLYIKTIGTILNYLDSYIDDDIIVLVDEKQVYKLLYRDKKLYEQTSNSVKLLDTNLSSFSSLDSNVVNEITRLGSDIETSIKYLKIIRDNLAKLLGKLNIEGEISEISEFSEIYKYSGDKDRGTTMYLTLYYKNGSIYYDVKYNNNDNDPEFIAIKTLFQPSLIGRLSTAIKIVSEIFLKLKKDTNEWTEDFTPVVANGVTTGGKKASSTYKLNGDKVSLLINKKKLHRSVYVRGNGKAKYCKINNEFLLLSKLKNKVIE